MSDDKDVTATPLPIAPHTIAAIVSSSIAITAVVVGTYASLTAKIDAVTTKQAELVLAVEQLRTAGTDDRFRGKDADRTWSVFRELNREAMPGMKVPVPTSIRDGKMEVYP